MDIRARASLSCQIPANGKYARQIKIANLSESDFPYVMHTWGSDDIRITSTLNTAQTMRQEPGPVIFDTTDFHFCWLANNVQGWRCITSDAWFKRLPGPHLP